MNPPSADQNFEKFRKERRQRRAQFGSAPATAPRSHGSKDADAYEARQVQETRLTRDVHDFFAQATKQAATIVEKVTQVAEAETAQRLVREMHEFLEQTIRRAANFMHMVQATHDGAMMEEREPHLSNLVGQPLDGFRNEGTAQLADKHLGQDPFDQVVEEPPTDAEADAPEGDGVTEVTVEETVDVVEETPVNPLKVALEAKPAAPAAKAPAKAAKESAPAAKASAKAAKEPAPTAKAPATGKAKGATKAAEPPAEATDASADLMERADLLLGRVCRDPATLKRALKALVKTRVLTKDEAREIYRSTLQGSDA